MGDSRRATFWHFLLLCACASLVPPSSAHAQPFSPSFELSETVHVDEADSATRAHLERVKAYVADEQWDEAVETLRQVMETHGRKVVPAAPGRYVSVADYCHLQIAALPAEALELYRGRVDPLAGKWYADGIAAHDVGRLRQIVDQTFCSSWGDDALWALGEMALERGEHAAARGYWEALIQQPPTTLNAEHYRRAAEHGGLKPADFELLTKWYQRDTTIEPSLYRLVQSPPPNDDESAALVRIWTGLRLPATRLEYPGTTLPLAEIRARLTLVSILEGNLARAKGEVAAYTRAYPIAEGILAGRQANFSKGLAMLLAAAGKWPALARSDDWPTFAGNFSRLGVGERIKEIGPPVWKEPLELGDTISADVANNRAFSYRRVAEDASALLSYHPVVAGDLVLWSNSRYVFAFDLQTGKPAWPGDPTKPPGVIYDNETVESQPLRPHRGLGVPRFTLTVHEDRLYARLGSQVTSRSVEAFEYQLGHLVCLDLAAEGRLVWKLLPEADRWSFEGPPVVDGPNVYVAMRRSDVRPQAYVACLDAETGQQRWRTLVCSAETPGGGQNDEITHNLLTLNEGVLYLNTNLGAVAALEAHDGRVKWIRLYTRARKASSDGVDKRADHFYRDLNPCVYHQGLVYAAPSDSEWILAIDATTGQVAWDSRLPDDAIHLLGISQGMLLASGNKLWWLDATGGRVRAEWPGRSFGFGRGTIAGDQVLWTSRDALYTFDVAIAGATPAMRRAPVQLGSIYNATGGNLVVAKDRLLLATADKLYAFGVRTSNKSEISHLKSEIRNPKSETNSKSK
jgi:hypothetical protein